MENENLRCTVPDWVDGNDSFLKGENGDRNGTDLERNCELCGYSNFVQYQIGSLTHKSTISKEKLHWMSEESRESYRLITSSAVSGRVG